MAHLCPECGMKCHCGGDIDDLCFEIDQYCCHCEDEEDEEDFYNDDQLEHF